MSVGTSRKAEAEMELGMKEVYWKVPPVKDKGEEARLGRERLLTIV